MTEQTLSPTRAQTDSNRTGTIAALLAVVLGIYNLLFWFENGFALNRNGSWLPLFFLITAAACFVAAAGFYLERRWGVVVFGIACLILVARLALLIVTPTGYVDTTAAVNLIFEFGVLVALTVAALLVEVVMLFRRSWLSTVGLAVAAIIILPLVLHAALSLILG